MNNKGVKILNLTIKNNISSEKQRKFYLIYWFEKIKCSETSFYVRSKGTELSGFIKWVCLYGEVSLYFKARVKRE